MLSKGRFSFWGNASAVSFDSLEAKLDPAFRPFANVQANLFRIGNFSMDLTGRYFPKWEKQDDFGTVGISCALRRMLRF